MVVIPSRYSNLRVLQVKQVLIRLHVRLISYLRNVVHKYYIHIY